MRGERDYSKGKIYQIISNDGKLCYVGSTTKDYLSQRFFVHKKCYLTWKNGTKSSYLTSYEIFDKYGVDNCTIELLEDYPCDNVNQLNAKEGEYIRAKKQQGGCVNKQIMGRLVEEYQKEYREKNKEELSKKKLFIGKKQKKIDIYNKENIIKKIKNKNWLIKKNTT